jgi:hypothetical protein
VVVGSGEGAQVAQAVDGDGVVLREGLAVVVGNSGRRTYRSRVTDGTGVSGDGTSQDIVGGFSTDQGTVTAQNDVRGEGGSLNGGDVGRHRVRNR